MSLVHSYEIPGPIDTFHLEYFSDNKKFVREFSIVYGIFSIIILAIGIGIGQVLGFIMMLVLFSLMWAYFVREVFTIYLDPYEHTLIIQGKWLFIQNFTYRVSLNECDFRIKPVRANMYSGVALALYPQWDPYFVLPDGKKFHLRSPKIFTDKANHLAELFKTFSGREAIWEVKRPADT